MFKTWLVPVIILTSIKWRQKIGVKKLTKAVRRIFTRQNIDTEFFPLVKILTRNFSRRIDGQTAKIPEGGGRGRKNLGSLSLVR
jgi:hypothetical protein